MRDKVRNKTIFFLSRAHDFGQTLWAPHVDVYRRSRSWLIKCDLAGIRVEDLAISAKNSTLLITGIRHDPLADERWEHYSMEIPYSRFERSVTLPQNVERARMLTEYRDGMLLIRVRFDEEDK